MLKKLTTRATRQTNKAIRDFNKEVNELTSIKDILNGWRMKQRLTPAIERKLKAGELSLTFMKKWLKDRNRTLRLRELDNKIAELTTICNADLPNSITINIEWVKSRTWGHNPNATAEVNTPATYNAFHSGSITGCGYDKESTAIAQALNQSNSVRKLLFKYENKLKEVYGHRGGQLSSGVGTSCYYRIFEACGYKMERVATGKLYDCYTIKKK